MRRSGGNFTAREGPAPVLTQGRMVCGWTFGEGPVRPKSGRGNWDDIQEGAFSTVEVQKSLCELRSHLCHVPGTLQKSFRSLSSLNVLVNEGSNICLEELSFIHSFECFLTALCQALCVVWRNRNSKIIRQAVHILVWRRMGKPRDPLTEGLTTGRGFLDSSWDFRKISWGTEASTLV